MKNKVLLYAIFAMALITVTFSCDKDSDVITSFPFSIMEEHPDSTIINYAQETNFKINVDREVTSNTYYFKYEVLKGKGAYSLADGTPIPENEFVKLSSLSPKFLYKSPEIGEEKVNVLIKDSGHEDATLELLYNVVHNPYAMELNSPSNQAKVKEPKPISFSLFNTGPDKSVTYERAFYLVQGSGQLFLPDNETEIPLETFEPANEGTVNFNLSFDDFGDSKVVVATKDSNNQIKNDTLNFQVSGVDVTFIAATDSNSSFLDQPFNVNFGVSEDQGEGGQYQLRYQIDEGEADIFFNDVQLAPGILYDVELGGFSWQAVGQQQGPLEITFILKNELGMELSKTVTITIIEAGILFDAVPLASEVLLGDSIDFNASISETPSPQPPYTLKFTTSGSGKVTYNETEYNPGQNIPITESDFSFKFTPLSVGQQNLVFTLNNAVPIQAIDQVDILVQDPTMNFEVVPVATQVILGSSIGFNASIDETPVASPPYTMKFATSGSGKVTYNNTGYNPGESINIVDANFNFVYTPLSVGQHALIFTATNSVPVQAVDQVNIQVLQPTLDFSATPQKAEALVGESVSFTASITETPAAAPPYNLTFATSGNGVLIYNNTEYDPGENIVVNTPNFNFKYKGQSLGNHQITLTASNQVPVEDVVVKNINFKNANFNFSATPNDNSLIVGIPENINFNLDNLGEQQTLQMKFTVNSGDFILKEGGQTRTPGIFYNVNAGNFAWQITSNSEENIDITFTVKNNFNLQKLADVDINSLDPSFDFTLGYPPSILTETLKVPIQLNLNGSNAFSYTLTYTTNNGGVLLKNGNVVAQNTSISPGDSNFELQFVNVGNHQVNFDIKNNLNNSIEHAASFGVNQTPFSFLVNGLVSVQKDEPLPFVINLSGSNNLSYKISRSILTGAGSLNFNNNSPINQGNNNFIYTPSVSGQHKLRFTVTDNFGKSVIVDKIITVTNPPPVINFITNKYYTKSNCDTSPFQETCDLNFVVKYNYTSATTLTKYRIKVGNTVGPEKSFLPNLLNTVTHPSGKIKLAVGDQVNDGNVTLKTNSLIEIQIKDSDGQWSEWFEVQTPPSYGLTFN